MEESGNSINYQLMKKKINLKYKIKKSQKNITHCKNYLSLLSKNQQSSYHRLQKKEDILNDYVDIPSINYAKKQSDAIKVEKLKKIEQRKSQKMNSVKKNKYRLRKRKNESQIYLRQIGNIIVRGLQLGRSKTLKMKKIINEQNIMEKKYSKLKEHSQSILLGNPIYKLQQQIQGKYKNQLRQMWMRTDK